MADRFAAYDDTAVFGIGRTPDEAMADAKEWGVDCDRVAEIAPDLFDYIAANGRDGFRETFTVCGGFLARTTGGADD